MHPLDRRAFLGTTLGSLAMAAGSPLSAQNVAQSTGARPDTLFLTWQRDPTTTMTVQWLGADREEKGTFAEVGATGSWHPVAARRRPYPMTDQHLFRAELTGLKPGTEYRFRIGEVQAPSRFRTMPAKATDTFQFVSAGYCDTNAHAIVYNILAAKQDPMFALIGGDPGYDNGKLVDKSLGFLRNYSRHMVDSQGRLIPMVVCIGNHEVNGGYGKPRQYAPFFFAAHDGLYAERCYATLDFGDYLSLVLLDTGHIAPIAGEQAAWLDKALADRIDRSHLIAVIHVPAYPSYRKPDGDDQKPGTGSDNRKHWVPRFERHNFNVVLEHHDHTFKRTHPLRGGRVDAKGLVYLGDRSWGKLRAPSPPESRSCLAASSGAYHMTLHQLEGERRYHLALEETGRVVDVCMTQKRPRRAPGRGRPERRYLFEFKHHHSSPPPDGTTR